MIVISGRYGTLQIEVDGYQQIQISLVGYYYHLYSPITDSGDDVGSY